MGAVYSIAEERYTFASNCIRTTKHHVARERSGLCMSAFRLYYLLHSFIVTLVHLDTEYAQRSTAMPWHIENLKFWMQFWEFGVAIVPRNTRCDAADAIHCHCALTVIMMSISFQHKRIPPCHGININMYSERIVVVGMLFWRCTPSTETVTISYSNGPGLLKSCPIKYGASS